ncbi:hypothetical protein AAVH_08863 [Aphelenchoides avenae]|nr:hypothetical protein AAVH_08863 [Aphelenchus avenae]
MAFMVAAVGPYRSAIVSFFRRGRCKGKAGAPSVAMSSVPKADSNMLRAVNRPLHSDAVRKMPTSVA